MTNQKFPPRPQSLKEISLQVAEGRQYNSAVKEFIDEVIAAADRPRSPDGLYALPESFYADEPIELPSPIHMAHLGGLSEQLAVLCGKQPPAWSEKKEFFLKTPVFLGGEAFRPRAVEETPSAFRRRLLFCGPTLQKLFAVTKA